MLIDLKRMLGYEDDDTSQDITLQMYIDSAKEYLLGAGVPQSIVDTSIRAKNAILLYSKSQFDNLPMPPIFNSLMTQLKNEVVEVAV